MSVPSNAKTVYSKMYLAIGPTWQPGAESYETEIGGNDLPIVRVDAAPLILMFVNESRSVSTGNSYDPDGTPAGGGSTTLNYGSPGLYRHTYSVGGEDAYRWVRVAYRPEVGASSGLLNDFDIESWGGALNESGVGGWSVSMTVPDPDRVLQGQLTDGVCICIYVEEFEDGALQSATEHFCGFIVQPEYRDDPDRPSVHFEAVTAEQFMGRQGVDGTLQIFMDQDLHDQTGVADLFGGIYVPTTGLLSISPNHVMNSLTLGQVINHLMRWHLWATIDGDAYSLRSVVDLVRDTWNDGGTDDYKVWVVSINQGNLVSNIRGFLPHGLWLMYSDKRSSLVVTKIDEAKDTPDDPVGALDPDQCYGGVKYIAGPVHPVGQVVVVQTPASVKAMSDDVLITKYPTTRDPAGAIVEPNETFWVTTQAGAYAIGRAIYQHSNSQDRVSVELAGAPFDLHNKFTLNGDTWTVERVRFIAGDSDFLSGLRSEVVARKVG